MVMINEGIVMMKLLGKYLLNPPRSQASPKLRRVISLGQEMKPLYRMSSNVRIDVTNPVKIGTSHKKVATTKTM
jgi:hypothetical protein